jgi:hypothetical protein
MTWANATAPTPGRALVPRISRAALLNCSPLIPRPSRRLLSLSRGGRVKAREATAQRRGLDAADSAGTIGWRGAEQWNHCPAPPTASTSSNRRQADPAHRTRSVRGHGSGTAALVFRTIELLPTTIGYVNHNEAYESLLEQLLPSLSAVETEESAGEFSARAADWVRSQAAVVPEFYIGEFLNIFKGAVVRQGRADIAACEQVKKDAELEADLAMVELNARLATAQAADDREAEHAVWREREERQSACQAKIDAATRRIGTVDFRLAALQALASALDFDFT